MARTAATACCSLMGLAYALMKNTHTASQPASSRAWVCARTCAKSTAVCKPPSARTRSSTSRRKSRGTTGVKLPRKPQVCGRSRRRISNTSRKPRVVMMPVRATLRSNKALVPTVVPCTMVARVAATPCEAALASEPLPSLTRTTPFMKPRASSPRVEGTLTMRAEPSRSSSTNKSVNVPPTSTPTTRCGVTGGCVLMV